MITVKVKKNCLQNRICHKLAPSNDFTIIPPKLKLKAPKITSNEPECLFKGNKKPIIGSKNLITVK